MTKQKQVQPLVEKHLKRYGSITDLQCFLKFKGRRLSSVIHRLRKKMDIETIMVKQDGVFYAKYKLLK